MLLVRTSDPDRDALRIAEIHNQYDPEPIVAASYAEKMKKTPPKWSVVRLSAEKDGEMVAFAYARRNPDMKPGLFLLTIGVNGSDQGMGVGDALLPHVVEAVRAAGGRRLVAMVRESHPYASNFFAKRGFDLKMVLREGILDVQQAEARLFSLPAGFRLVRWSDLEDTSESRARFVSTLQQMDEDEPGTEYFGGFDSVSIERDAFDPDLSDPHYCYLVDHEGEWVAHHQFKQVEPDSWDQASITFTGTLKAFRRRGLATALKNLAVAEMKALGVQRVITHNDSTNIAMLAINNAQGFVEKPGWAMMEITI